MFKRRYSIASPPNDPCDPRGGEDQASVLKDVSTPNPYVCIESVVENANELQAANMLCKGETCSFAVRVVVQTTRKDF